MNPKYSDLKAQVKLNHLTHLIGNEQFNVKFDRGNNYTKDRK